MLQTRIFATQIHKRQFDNSKAIQKEVVHFTDPTADPFAAPPREGRTLFRVSAMVRDTKRH
jgi:hypothetical protein